ncbi:MAG: phenylalanine--tRNA ligase subunit beta, partial [Flavobacteriales bacterium]|nr:phenylalanine--tRNA ligase subunit beta [Flavobacteriales bacterium]
KFLELVKRNKIKFQKISTFPVVRRDFALLIDQEVTFAQLRNTIFKTEKKLLRAVDIFDVYSGKGIPEGKKSYAISVLLQDEEKTLNDKTIDAFADRLITALKKEYDLELR